MQAENKKVLKNSPFIRKLSQTGYAPCALSLLLSYPELSDGAKLCYLHMERYGLLSINKGIVDNDGNPIIFPSKETIASDMGKGRDRVRLYINELEKAGLCKRLGKAENRSTDSIVLYVPGRERLENKARLENKSSPCLENKAQNNIDKIKNEKEKEGAIAPAPTPDPPPVPDASVAQKAGKNAEPLSTRDMEVSAEITPGKQPRALMKEARFTHKEKDLPRKTASQVIEEIMNRTPRGPSGKEKKRKEKSNCNDIIADFSARYKSTIGGVPPLVSGKEKKLAKELIEHYGYGYTDRMLTWVLDNWALMKKEKRLDGTPTVSLIYGFRAYIQSKVDSEVPGEEVMDETAW